MTRDKRRRGREIRKARRQLAQFTPRQRTAFTDGLRLLLEIVREQFNRIWNTALATIRFVINCLRTNWRTLQDLYILWPPPPEPRQLLHNGKKPR